MGNKLVGRRGQVVDEKYTRPQGLYQHKDIDHKKLRKLILGSELAPCYPGHEENGFDLEECPICFLYYPSLNRSTCCPKGICTECFLQMKTPNSSRPTQCPFCKTSNYAVKYRGLKTKEEKGLEQIEEQRVIEAKIRMRQQELQDEEERMMKRREINSPSSITEPTEAEYCSPAVVPSLASVMESDVLVTGQDSRAAAAIKQPPCPRQNRDDDFDLDLEDLMVMEAIWLSIQENGRHRNPVYGDSIPSEHYIAEDHSIPDVTTRVVGTSSSGGLASAIAALAEHQQIGVGSSSNYNENMSTYNTLPGCSRLTNRDEQDTKNYQPTGSSIGISPDRQLTMTRDPREWVNHTSEVAEVGTSYADSEAVGDSVRPLSVHLQDDTGSSFQPITAPIVPESFEEQMMLAMAVSLAEARARTSPPGVAWH